MFLDRQCGKKITKSGVLYLRLLILFPITLLTIYGATNSTDSYAKSPKVPLVVVEKAQTKPVIKQIHLTGTVTSPKIGRVSPEISGQVKSLNVDIGDQVKKGDVLIQLDREIEELTLKAYQASTQQSREEHAEAKRRHESGKRLKKQSGISQEEIEQRQAEVKITEAALQRQLAEQQKQQAIVKRHTIKAPFSGVISEKLAEVGEWLETGKPVLTLIAMDELKIDFQVPQEFYTQIGNHSHISISLDALQGKKTDGKITAVVPVSDPSARTFLIRAKLNIDDVNMTPGMSAQGILQLNSGQTGVVVSRDAVMRYPDGRVTIWMVRLEDNIAKVFEQRVKVGHGFNGKVTIKEGLPSGAVVVVQGNESLKEGQTVRIQQSQ